MIFMCSRMMRLSDSVICGDPGTLAKCSMVDLAESDPIRCIRGTAEIAAESHSVFAKYSFVMLITAIPQVNLMPTGAARLPGYKRAVKRH